MTVTDDLIPDRTRQALLTGALRELAFAAQALGLYPSKSPVVREAVDRARAGLTPLAKHGTLTLEIRPSSLMVEGCEVGAGHDAVRKLAGRLHHRRVARVRLEGSFDATSLMALAQGAGMDRQELESQGGMDAFLGVLRVPGIRVDLFEPDRLFDEAGRAIQEDGVWDTVLQRYGEGRAVDLTWAEMVADGGHLADFLAWTLENAGSVEELADCSRVDLLRLACERLGTAGAETGEGLGPLAAAASAIYDRVDPEAWIELLSESIMVPTTAPGTADEAASGDGGGDAAGGAPGGEAGGAPGGEGGIEAVDATRAIAGGLGRAQLESLIAYAIRTREQASPRLMQLFVRLLEGRDDRHEIASAAERTLREGGPGDRSEALVEAWPNLQDVLLGEIPDPYFSERYRATLDHLQAGTDVGPQLWPLERIRLRFHEMEPLFVLRRKCEILVSLMDRETDAAEYAGLAGELEKALPEFVLHEEYGLVEQIVATFARHRDPATDRLASQAAIADEVLARFCNRHTLLQLVRSLTGKPASVAATGLRIFSHLGSTAVPGLFSALWQEKSRPGRLLLLQILTSMGDEVVPEIEKHLEDERWFVARNLVWIIRELGIPELVRPLRVTIRHPDPRVRRESALALGKIGGSEAAELLLTRVGDVDRETRLAAIWGLGTSGLQRAVPLLRPDLELSNWHGRNSDILEATIIALTRLGDRESVPRLRRLARTSWLFPRRRRRVREAARRALQTLGARQGGWWRALLERWRGRTGWGGPSHGAADAAEGEKDGGR
jgi:hypothetical protein